MKKFKFTKTVILWGTEYKEGQELEVKEDGGVRDTDGSWLFDYDSTSAIKYGVVINK